MRISSLPAAALAAVLSIALLSACGQKGPLYMRDNPPAGVKVPKPPVPKPVPYPADASGTQPQD
jgi:predicted small lipoprotein YifL